MTTRRILLGSLLALAFAACSGSTAPATTTPSAAASIPAASAPAASTGAGSSTGTGTGSSAATTGLAGFCATFASDIQATWPNIDAATAARVGPMFRTWADGTDLTPIKADLTTIFNWLAVRSINTASATPPPDVATAFDHVKTFAASSC